MQVKPARKGKGMGSVAAWREKEYSHNGQEHYVDAATKKVLGGIERTWDDFWGAWLTADGKPHISLGVYTEDSAARAAVERAYSASKKRKGRK